MFNHESALTTPFEAPYAGQWTSNSFTYDPREAFRYWATRHYPRRVIYSSSVVPLFHSDLYAFEKISAYRGLGEFDANKFLEDFYLYFYNLLLEPGDTYWNEPVITVSDVERYNFVSRSIENMILHNVLSVKDHAQDIADELAELIEYVTAAQDPITQEWYYTFPDDIIEAALGNEIGLKDVIFWCANRINEHAQTSIPLPGSNQNLIEYWKTYVKPNFNAKIVKASLVNPEQEMISEFRTEYPIFAGPRRVRLWPTPQSSGLTAWGCEDDNFCENVERRKTYESSLNVKTRVLLEDVGLVEVPFEYESLYSGQEVYFAVTPRGKVRAFGKKPPAPLTEEDIIWGNIGFNRVVMAETAEEATENRWYYDAVGGLFNDEVYPAEEIGVDAVPYHLSVASEAESAYYTDSPDVSEPFDGRVEKIVNKGKFAVALVSYQDGIVVGANLFEGGPWSNSDKRNYNTGHDITVSYYSPSSIRLPRGDDPPTIQSTCNYVLDNPSSGIEKSYLLSHSYKWNQFSNSGWQSPSLCTWPPTTLNYPEG